MGLLPDAAHHQDVVVGPECHQEDEHEKRQDEADPGLPAEVNKHDPDEAERGQVREHDARHQVERRDETAEHDREQQRDEHRDDRDDPDEIRPGDVADVGGEFDQPVDARG